MNTASLMQRLREAAIEGDIHKFKQLQEEDPALLDRFVDLSNADATENPLHIAALHGHVDFTCEVLQLKPQLAEKPNKDGCLPLHLAAAWGHLQVIEKLAHHADQVSQTVLYLHRENKYGYMPVHIAAINGKHEIVEMLVQKCNETLGITTNRNENLLHLAVKANCLASVSYFINKDVNINEQNVTGDTCLHLACQRKNLQVITELLGKDGIDVNATNSRGLTPLDVLLVSSWGDYTDVSLVNMLRRAGGEEAGEGGTPSARYNRRNSVRTLPRRAETDAQTLLLIATLIATITVTAISNPPGGFIQAPFDKGDEKNSTWDGEYFTSHHVVYPVGRPALLFELQPFFMLDSVAMFLTIFVVLVLLLGPQKNEVTMKLLAGVVWLAAMIMVLAFAFAFVVVCLPLVHGAFASDYAVTRVICVTVGSILYQGGYIWGAVRVFMYFRSGEWRNWDFLNWVIFGVGASGCSLSVIYISLYDFNRL